MNKIRAIFYTLLLIGSNGYWLYCGLDQGISLTYLQASYDTLDNKYEQLLKLANLDLVGLSADEAIAVISTDTYGAQPFVKEGCLWAAGICLRLNQNNIVTGIE